MLKIEIKINVKKKKTLELSHWLTLCFLAERGGGNIFMNLCTAFKQVKGGERLSLDRLLLKSPPAQNSPYIKGLYFGVAYSIILQSAQPTLGKWKVCSSFLKMEDWHQLFGILLHVRFVSSPSSIYFSSHVCMLLWTCSFLFYMSGNNPILFELPCSNHSSSGHWELFQLAPRSLWRAPVIVVFLVACPCFPTLQDAPDLSYVFPSPTLESAISTRTTWCFKCVCASVSSWHRCENDSYDYLQLLGQFSVSFLLSGLLLLISCWLESWGPINQSPA